MINFPVFRMLKVDNYLLYPGNPLGSPGLDIDFRPGPTLVIGSNGLGKSTLLLIMRYLVTGPTKARTAGFAGERSDLLQTDARFFANRVLDGGKTATASTIIRLGEVFIKVKRKLSDLSLVEALLGDSKGERSISSEDEYRTILAKSMNLANFEDALRVIERVTFFVEAREPLIWDTSAQLELFRAILVPQHSAILRELEGKIVTSDSLARNLNANIYTYTKRWKTQTERTAQSGEVVAQLADAENELEKERAEEALLVVRLDECDERRFDARIESKQADRKVSEAETAYEQIKYEVLRHAFAGVPPTEQYIFLKIVTERLCVACNNPAEDYARELEQRRENNLCLICGQSRHQSETITSTTAALQNRAEVAHADLKSRRKEQAELKEKLSRAEVEYSKIDDDLEGVRQRINTSERSVRRLRNRLPKADNDIVQTEDALRRLRREVEIIRKERDNAEENIISLLAELTKATELVRNRLAERFQIYADLFFAEKVRLVYAPRRERIGQSGRIFELPGFEVEMTSGATEAQFIRRKSDQVSLSQREYLDIIFRISIVDTIGNAQGSFVIDGPEGSVDAVFAGRAGNLFANLSNVSSKSSTILACNVVAGDFIPNTLRNYPNIDARKERLVNLLDLASPTTALTELRPSYQKEIDILLNQSAV